MYRSDGTVQIDTIQMVPFRRYRSDGTVFLREEKIKTVGTKKAKTVAAILLVLALIIPI